MLRNKNIVLGITGGIAAYKCPHLVRLLVKQGANVKVVLTDAASQFVTPQTLAVVSKNEVVTGFFDKNNNWNNHVALAEWADLILIAPLTANSIAKMATGVCDNVLLATYFSSKSKIMVAPAMDLDMYQHPTVKHNLKLLEQNGNLIIPAENGELASGLSGEGRMAEPETIIEHLTNFFSTQLPLSGKKVLINAGPTYEAIDPVRFIGNRSSGKMGIALAECFAENGAQVTLVLGPSNETISNKSINLIRVESSEEMYDATLSNYPDKDIVVCSAAVADYKPSNPSNTKIKKQDSTFNGLNLELVETKDILKELGNIKTSQILVGFALETNDLLQYASKKLKAKNLDIIIANSATDKGSGFGTDTNKISIIDKHNNIINFELKTKREVAKDIIQYINAFSK